MPHPCSHPFGEWFDAAFACVRNCPQCRRGAKTELVDHAIEATVGEFGITDLERACPGVSRDLIRLRLRDLKAAWRI